MTQPALDVFVDSSFDPIYARDPLVLVDVGARGGLKGNWFAARRHLRLLGFEPDPVEFKRLSTQAASDQPARTFFDVALHNQRGPIRLHVARDRGLTSVFEPNRAFLDAFPEADRFDTVKHDEVQGDTLDHLLQARGIDDVDFLKVDTQGSELLVLQGASRLVETSALGVEVEVEFAPIYKDQPLFADVDAFLRSRGFLLFDLRPCYWKRTAGRGVGGPRGQIIWADALYLRDLPELPRAVDRLDVERRAGKVLRAVSIAVLYGYLDYALEITRHAGSALTADQQRTIEARLTDPALSRGPLPKFPGKRTVATLLHRLWRLCRQPDDAWSVSDAEIGNFGR